MEWDLSSCFLSGYALGLSNRNQSQNPPRLAISDVGKIKAELYQSFILFKTNMDRKQGGERWKKMGSFGFSQSHEC